MEIVKTAIEGVLILKPRVYGDARGYFCETFVERAFGEQVAPVHFVQDNESLSTYGVIRGLHFQAPPFAQSKLVRCVQGAVLDVAVDIRRHSPTYGQYVSVVLSDENKQQLFIPQGFAHGFAVLTPTAHFLYKCSNYYAPQAEGGILPLDGSLHIDWQIPTEKVLLSPKDGQHPAWEDFISPFI